jgi:hypothetical protein
MTWTSSIAMAMTMTLLVGSPVFGVTITEQQRVKDPDGKTLFIIVTCNQCKDPKKGGTCLAGAMDGFLDGEACGQCLQKSNWGHRIGYPYDLHFTGSLKDASGKPLPDQFVKVHMPNGWGVTTRTIGDGSFRAVLGATMERQSRKAISKDLGTLTFKKGGDKENTFNLFMLPESFKPCAPSGGK